MNLRFLGTNGRNLSLVGSGSRSYSDLGAARLFVGRERNSDWAIRDQGALTVGS